MAQGAASTPFQTPAAPVAGFSQDQLGAFQGVRNAQGMAQPYFNQAASYTNQSAQPISDAQIANYYNPMADSVTRQMQNIFGQQQRNTTGQLTQAAGGVGADRIAVGQSELANQQGLAAGQTYAGLYNNALGAAQQDSQRQANAGYAMQAAGTGAQNAALQGAGAQLNTGGLQQQLQQAQLMSPYNQQLQQLAYPFQTAQYLAGITGGLAPALGGTTNQQGTSVNQPPAPSIWSQIAGGAGLGLAAYNAYGGKGSGVPSPVSGYSPEQSGYTPNQGYTNDSGMGIYGPGMADGGAVGSDPFAMPGSIVPDIALQPGSGQRPMLQQPQPAQASKAPESDLSKIASMAMKILPQVLPMMLASGGSVSPHSIGEGFADGGLTSDQFDNRFPMAGDISAGSFMGNPRGNAAIMRYDAMQNPLQAPGVAPVQNSVVPQGQSPFQAMPPIRPGGPALGPKPPGPIQNAMSMDAAPTEDPSLPPGAEPTAGAAPGSSLMPAMPTSEAPYPEAGKKDTGTELSRSPWLALAQASLATMAGTSPYAGVNIGKGGMEGIKVLENQRKEARAEQDVNLKAKQLWQDAQKHLDQYRSPTAYQKAQIEHQERQDKIAEENNAYYPPVANVFGDGYMQIPKKAGMPARYFKVDENGVPIETTKDGKPTGNPAPAPAPPPKTVADAPVVDSPIAPAGGKLVTQSPSVMTDTSKAGTAASRNPEIASMYRDPRAQSQGRASAVKELGAIDKASNDTAILDQRAKQIRRNLDVVTDWTKSLDPKLKSSPYLRTLFDPGSDGDARQAAIIKYNTYAKNSNLPQIPQEVIAAMVAMGKDSVLGGFKNITAEGLSAREAQPIIKAAMGAMPGFNNPESANRLLLAGMEETAQAAKDKKAFFEDYRRKNGGMSDGWQTAFDKQFPPSLYVARTVIRTLPEDAKAALPANVAALRQARDAVLLAEKSGDPQAAVAATQKYNMGKANFDKKFGHLSNYYMFGTM